MASWVLITGASSGLGLMMAKIYAEKGHHLVLVARHREALDDLAIQLKAVYPIQIINLVKDLSRSETPMEIATELADRKIDIEILINNAGLGDFKAFHASDLNKIISICNVNILALTQLTRLFLERMVIANHGKIMNIGSVAGFIPGPFMAVYYASKAYVLSFTEAIRRECKGKNIQIFCFSPGPISTNFAKNAGIRKSNYPSAAKMPIEKACRQAIEQLEKGKPLFVSHRLLKCFIFLTRFMPRSMVSAISGSLLSKREAL